jgi:hypothetical protein
LHSKALIAASPYTQKAACGVEMDFLAQSGCGRAASKQFLTNEIV